jgi:hypothetical protein
MDEQIMRLLKALDGTLAEIAGEGERLDLYLIGRSALALHHHLEIAPGGTRDVDIVQRSHPSPPLFQKAIELFGQGTAKADELGLYLEAVPSGLPPLPCWYDSRSKEVPGDWKVIRLWQLEIHDLAATKLKSFRRQDRDDLRFLCDASQLHAERLRASLESAFRWTSEKDGDPDRERAFANLERVVAYLDGRSSTL